MGDLSQDKNRFYPELTDVINKIPNEAQRIEMINQCIKEENDRRKRADDLEKIRKSLEVGRDDVQRDSIVRCLLDQFKEKIKHHRNWSIPITISVRSGDRSGNITRRAVDFFCGMLQQKGLVTETYVSCEDEEEGWDTHVSSVEIIRTWTFSINILINPKSKL